MTDEKKKTPVILDTDIGSDIDDTWALLMLLNSPELDLKLLVAADGNTPVRAAIAAKFLEAAGRADVPVGIGIKTRDEAVTIDPWVRGYRLEDYPGAVYTDGVQAIVDTIMHSDGPVTVLAIGPLTNIAAALEWEPRIAEKARFVGMQGSVFRGYEGSETVHREYNVYMDPKACQKVFAASWPITITPLDTCGVVKLTGNRYRRVLESKAPGVRALMESYEIWGARQADDGIAGRCSRESSVLFDTVAVYLAYSEELLEMRELGIAVTDDAYTRVEPNARLVCCAAEWKDLERFEDLLVDRLTV